MKKIYGLVPLTLAAAVALAACGNEKDVSTEAQETTKEKQEVKKEEKKETKDVNAKDVLKEAQQALKDVKGMEVETSLIWDITAKEDGKEPQSRTIKADVQEERSQDMKMHRVLNYETPDGSPSEEQYITEEGIIYTNLDGQWLLLEETIYQQEIGLFDTQVAYISAEGVLTQMLMLIASSSNYVDYKEDGDTYVLTLASMHEKVADTDELFKYDLGSDVTTDINVYDVEVVVNQKTSFVEKVIIDVEGSMTQGNTVNKETIKLEGHFSESDAAADIQVPQEALDEAVAP
ncbi:DUF6612 family protein [Bacillus sp. FSL W7-1360]